MEAEFWAMSDGDRLHYHRRRAGLTQVKLADKVGVSSAFISQIEQGRDRPSPAVALRISAVLNQKASAIFKTLFPGEINEMLGTEIYKPVPPPAREPTALEKAMARFRQDETILSDDECRLIASSMLLSVNRLFSKRFDRNGNVIVQKEVSHA